MVGNRKAIPGNPSISANCCKPDPEEGEGPTLAMVVLLVLRVLTVSTVLAVELDGVTLLGLKVQLIPVPKPALLHENETALEKLPLTPVTPRVNDAAVPAVTVAVLGVGAATL